MAHHLPALVQQSHYWVTRRQQACHIEKVTMAGPGLFTIAIRNPQVWGWPIFVCSHSIDYLATYTLFHTIWFVLFYMDSLNKTRNICYTKVHLEYCSWRLLSSVPAQMSENKPIRPMLDISLLGIYYFFNNFWWHDYTAVAHAQELFGFFFASGKYKFWRPQAKGAETAN